MKIVGVGAGPNLLTAEAIAAIEGAEIIFGSQRAIELAREHIRCKAQAITEYTLTALPENAVILSTGDPMLSGLGKFAGKEDEIIPGISSLQLACSRLGKSIEHIAVITAHAKEDGVVKKRIIEELRHGKDVFILPGPSFGSPEIASLLASEGIRGRFFLCERLAYPDEKISTGTVEQPPRTGSNMYCIMIERY